MNFFVLMFLMLGFTLGHSEWNPYYILWDKNTEVLEDVEYQALKANVCKFLEKSWCSFEKAQLLMDVTMAIRPKVCVEIGVFAGSTVLPVAAVLRQLNEGKMYCIDAWSNEIVCRHMTENDPNRNWWSRVDMKQAFYDFGSMISKWSLQDVCVIIPKTSAEAAREIPEIDFLNIDGDYSQQGSMEDVMNYVPKVKSGGYILFSNQYVMIHGKQPKIKAFRKMLESCELIALIDQDNTVLFKKK